MKAKIKKFVAITTEGEEFLYYANSAHAVPQVHAEQICSILNKCRYKLKNGQKWHLYALENGYGEEYTMFQSFKFYKGILKEYSI